MLSRKFAGLIIAVGLMPFSTFAGVKVVGLDLSVTGAKGRLSIATQGRSSELPDIKVTGNTIEISIDRADAFELIQKRMLGADMTASTVGGKAVIRATLPYGVSSEGIDLGWKNDRIEVTFPRGTTPNKVAAPETVVSPKEATPPKQETEKTVTKEALNEDYLNGLMKENKQGEKPATVAKDEVSVKQAAPEAVTPSLPSKNNDSFSFAGYAAKFTVFLAMVLGLFYGIVQLLKKGVFTRGKLGFLNNSQLIEVLSTTYIAPKRSLLVVRAHKQIFLVANSETGLTFLSEMRDTTGLMKEGEKHVTGTNFDENLSDAQTAELMQAFKLKEDINESAPLPPDTNFGRLANAKDDIVKFSDELKKKAKKLRQIENRAN